ncbi:hypothetical protein PMAYCL1PPCAC_10552, partial [Pristionchus mayeri]
FQMSLRRTVDMISVSARGQHEGARAMLALGLPVIQVRARWEGITLRTLGLSGYILSIIKSYDNEFHSDMQFIPELEEIITISTRTIDLYRPPAA